MKYLIKSPTLLLDKDRCQKNIGRMVAKAKSAGIGFRPHFKTHQSQYVAQWLSESGVEKCTVSSVKMARYFAEQGWKNILIAFPVNPLESENINELAKNINLEILVYQPEALQVLSSKVSSGIDVKIELDLGSNRSGLLPSQREEIDALLDFIESVPNFRFTGFYSHPGHTYTSRSPQQVQKIYSRFMTDLKVLDKQYSRIPGFNITIGDTPGCTLIEDFGPIREISPGNFVFYDVMQVNIGSCDYDDIAVVMACPVVGKNKERKELLIHGGAVHFSKEVLQDPDGTTHFGKLAKSTRDGWEGTIPGCYLKSISQEHGLVHATDELLEETQIGDIIYIYPAHSCLTADLMKSYLTTDGALHQAPEDFMK